MQQTGKACRAGGKKVCSNAFILRLLALAPPAAALLLHNVRFHMQLHTLTAAQSQAAAADTF
jgi:hypothetical protein